MANIKGRWEETHRPISARSAKKRQPKPFLAKKSARLRKRARYVTRRLKERLAQNAAPLIAERRLTLLEAIRLITRDAQAHGDVYATQLIASEDQITLWRECVLRRHREVGGNWRPRSLVGVPVVMRSGGGPALELHR